MSNLKIFCVVVGCIIGLGIFFYFSQLYYFYYQDVIKTENSILRHQIPLVLPNAKEDYVSTWGAFGDFVGGTLNPLIGFISVLLLFATWNLTRKTLNFTKKELKNSNEILNIQQFDTIFWGLLDHLKKLEERLFENKGNLDEIYDDIFASQKYERVSLCREKILLNAELSQYFIVLYQLLKNIDVKLGHSDYQVKKAYSNIVRANVPTKFLQLLAINCYENFPEYKLYLEDFCFFEHMPFYNINNSRLFNLILIECLASYSLSVLDKSVYLQKYQTESIYKKFLDGTFKDKSNFLDIWLDGIQKKNTLVIDNSTLFNQNKVEIQYVIENQGEIFVSTVDGCDFTINGVPIVLGEPKPFVTYLTDRGLEFNLGKKWTVIINPLESEPAKVIKNPL